MIPRLLIRLSAWIYYAGQWSKWGVQGRDVCVCTSVVEDFMGDLTMEVSCSFFSYKQVFGEILQIGAFSM